MNIERCQHTDIAEVLSVWRAASSEEWLLDEPTFKCACMNHGDGKFVNLVAKDNNKVVGFISAQCRPSGEAGIIAVGVHPESQRRGIGRSLLEACGRELSNHGAKTISVGSGGSSYLWPGVPVTSTAGLSFFRKNGWKFDEELYDMVANLENVPTSCLIGFLQDNTRELHLGEEKGVIGFFQEHFPYWKMAYEQAIARKQHRNIIVALAPGGELAGAVLLFTNREGYYENSLAWRAMLGAEMGGFAALGVRQDLRGRGIGLRLAAHATLELKRRGVTNSIAGWTYLERLYGKIGYKVWRRYAMSNALAPENVAKEGQGIVSLQARKP